MLTALRRELSANYAWPGSVRELEQVVRRNLLTGRYAGELADESTEPASLRQIQAGALDARDLLANYCTPFHRRCGNYQEVARRTGFDRRTVRKCLQVALSGQ